MGYYFVTASKDASVYLQQPNQNTGLDEVLEVSKVYYGNLKDISRALLKFDLTPLSESIFNGSVSLDSVELLLRETESEEIPLEYTIYANPLYTSWEMGSGKRFDEISTQGVTWNYREGDTGLEWAPDGLVSGVNDANPNSGKGGVWYTSYEASQSFNYQSADLSIDMSEPVNAWLSGSITNEGVIIRHSEAFENNTNDYGILKFFSKETHTIYQPKLMIGYDDQQIVTGSLLPLEFSDEVLVKVKNLSKEIKNNTTTKIRVVGRERYPLRTFSSTFRYNDVKYLPSSSYYQITDYESNDIIVPFGEYSKISCDSNGNYFQIDFSNWEANRVYKIEFKVENNGEVYYFDDDMTFKIIDS